MDTHALIGITVDHGEERRTELGRVGSLEAAARLQKRLTGEQEILRFEVLELEPQADFFTVRSVTRDELRRAS